MSLWLDGRFWGPWIRRTFVLEIEWTRRAVLDHMIPSIPSAEDEGARAAKEAWEDVMSMPSDGSDDSGDYAEWAEEQGVEVYLRLTSVRQAAVNMSTVMLWHLLEQQMLLFHKRQVLKIQEEAGVLHESKLRDKLFRLDEFHHRLDEGGCPMKSCLSWPKVEELQLLANAVKHGPGKSLDKLYAIRPDLLDMPETDELSSFKPEPSRVERPAFGEDLYVRDADVVTYFDAAINLWQEFSVQIENHSAKK